METYDSQWINHWREGVNPGTRWDAGKCSPILAQLIANKELNVVNKRVLVPGCGRGYDVFCFAQAGAAAAVGLDLSQEAVAEAEEEKVRVLSAHPAAAAQSELVSGSFFEYEHQSRKQFDVGYDYTFLCALHPDMRRDWAQAWSRLLAPGGELITLIFPVGPGFVGNPPWQVSPELYQELLLPAGFEQVVLEPVPAGLSHKGREGREWLGRWRRTGSSSSSITAAAADAAVSNAGQPNSSTKSKI
jgi:SAM-dependent methyltransferase